jgi:hypothetical protein
LSPKKNIQDVPQFLKTTVDKSVSTDIHFEINNNENKKKLNFVNLNIFKFNKNNINQSKNRLIKIEINEKLSNVTELKKIKEPKIIERKKKYKKIFITNIEEKLIKKNHSSFRNKPQKDSLLKMTFLENIINNIFHKVEFLNSKNKSISLLEVKNLIQNEYLPFIDIIKNNKNKHRNNNDFDKYIYAKKIDGKKQLKFNTKIITRNMTHNFMTSKGKIDIEEYMKKSDRIKNNNTKQIFNPQHSYKSIFKASDLIMKISRFIENIYSKTNSDNNPFK